MFSLQNTTMKRGFGLAALSLILSACNHNDDNDLPAPPEPPPPVVYSYEVKVTNLTNGQPLSPVAVVLHQEGQLWQLGEPASVELETMAEGGDNSGLLALSVVEAMASGSGPIGPGSDETIMVSINNVANAKLSVATMLVNTNDGFSGLNGWDLGQLSVGDSWSTVVGAYDAGTEANTEAMGTIPGPADGGTGFDATRDDVDFVAMHPGVVSSADNLPTSILTAQHTFDNPVIRIQVTRTQ